MRLRSRRQSVPRSLPVKRLEPCARMSRPSVMEEISLAKENCWKNKKKGKKGGMCGVCHPKKKSKPIKKGGLNDLLLPAFLVGANTYFKKSNKNKTKKNKFNRKGRK